MKTRVIMLSDSIPSEQRSMEQVIKMAQEIDVIDTEKGLVECAEVYNMQEQAIKPLNRSCIGHHLNRNINLIIKN